MKTILASIAAAGVLVAGAFVAGVVTDSPAAAQTLEPTVAEDDERVGPLEDVLAGLVADDILTQLQADEVEERLRAAHEQLREERQDRREERRERRGERREDRAQIREYLGDGVIDASELAELGDDHPFNDPDGPFADATADGELTEEELRETLGQVREQRREARQGADA